MVSSPSSSVGRVTIVNGDIVLEECDIIVNAANAALSGGGGVDGAIHRAAGPQLVEACQKLGRCPPGQAVITPAFQLKAKYVVHAVGPVWRGGDAGEDALLASCYRASLALATDVQATTVAFPAISCGAYKYPVERAARVALETVLAYLDDHAFPQRVRFVCFDAKIERAFGRALSSLGPSEGL